MKKNLAPITLLAGVLLAMVFLAFRLQHQTEEKVLSQFSERQLLIARQTARQIESYFNSCSHDIRYLSSFTSLRHLDAKTMRTDVHRNMNHLKTEHTKGISVLDAKGKIVYSTGGGVIGSSHGLSDIYTWARKPASKGMVRLAIDKTDRQGISLTGGGVKPPSPGISLVTPLYRESIADGSPGPGGKFAGILLLTVDLEKMLAEQTVLLKPAKKPHTLWIWIMDTDGTLLLQSEHPSMVMRNIRKKKEECNRCHGSFDYAEKIATAKQGTVEYQLKGRQKKVAAFAPMAFENTSWIVVVNSPFDEVTGFIRDNFRDTFGLIGIVVVAIVLVSFSMYRTYRQKVKAQEEVKHLWEKQRLMEELQKSEERYRMIVETAHDIIWILDTQGKFTFVNHRGEEISGYRADELTGKSFAPLVHAEDLAKVQKIFMETLSGKPHFYDVRVYDNNGKCFILSVDTVPIIENNNIIGTLSSGRDITERKEAEEELRETRDYLENLLEYANAPIIVWDPGFRITRFNRAFERLTGRSAEEVLGNPLDILFPEGRREEVMAHIRRTITGERWESVEIPILRKDGVVRVALWNSANVHAADGAMVVATIAQGQDITERKEAEEEARSARARLEFLISSTPSVVYTCKPFGDYSVTFISTGIELLLGYTPSEFLEDPGFWARNIHPEDAPKVFADLPRLFETGHYAREYRFLSRDGTYRWMHDVLNLIRDADGNPLEIVGNWTDITEHKQAEEALLESEKRFRSIFDTANDGILIVKVSTKIFAEANPAICGMLGYTREELLRLGVEDIHPAPDLPHAIAEFNKQYRGETQVAENLPVKRKDGSVFYADVNASPVEFDGEPYQIGIFRDITERKLAEEEKERLQAQLQQAMKMEAVGRLAGGVAHDFNNLLTVIMGYSELLLKKIGKESPMHGELVQIKQAVERAVSLTKQLLAFSRKQIIEPKVVHLDGMVADMHSMLTRLIGEDIELQSITGKGLGSVKIDPGQFHQILMNLAVNARDAMPGGGKIVIETANVDLDESYCALHPYITPGRFVMLAVSDTGQGMNEEVRAHIFEPFFTTKERGKGTGLGLATTYGVVRQSGGSIDVYSEVGIGTTFKIYLPQVEEESVKPVNDDRPADLPGGTETVLLVEDEEILLDLCVQILKRLGYKVLRARNGTDAIAVAENYGDRIELLLTDVVMPEMNGSELATQLVLHHPETKVLFTSGYTDDAIVRHGVLDGGVSFIGKPYSPSALAKKIREVLDKA